MGRYGEAMPTSAWERIARSVVRDLGRTVVRELQKGRRGSGGGRPSDARRSPGGGAPTAPRGGYPGDHTGPVDTSYSPTADGDADPGEIVWAWVPYEEDHSRGKDRPALVVGLDGPWLLALQVTSQDHDRDAAQEARAGRYWMDIGSGAWDSRGRASEVRLNRVLRLDPGAVRREGAALDRATFDRVVAAMREYTG